MAFAPATVDMAAMTIAGGLEPTGNDAAYAIRVRERTSGAGTEPGWQLTTSRREAGAVEGGCGGGDASGGRRRRSGPEGRM